jgi:hypothetical protein
MNHLNDDAELYAVGLTERERDADIERHLARCSDCVARVIAAEAVGAALAGALQPIPTTSGRWRRPWMSVAAAAAMVFASTTAFEAMASHAAASRLAHADIALNDIATSHFGHNTLTSDSGIVARALYAPNGTWCYVIAANAPQGAHVSIRHGQQTIDGGLMHSGALSTLLIPDPGKPDEIDIVVGDHVVARGRRAD